MKLKKNQIVITALVAMIGAAGYLNYIDTHPETSEVMLTDESDLAMVWDDDIEVDDNNEIAAAEEMPEAAAADPDTAGEAVFVNSTRQDTLSLINIEAQACGTPVITYKTGGSPESVTEKTGFIVEQGDIEGMTNIINNIIGNNSYLCRLNCREYALANFDKENCFRNYIDLYESLAAR